MPSRWGRRPSHYLAFSHFSKRKVFRGMTAVGKYPEHPVGIPSGESGFLATNKGSGLLDAEQDRRIDGLEAQGFQLFHSAGQVH